MSLESIHKIQNKWSLTPKAKTFAGSGTWEKMMFSVSHSIRLYLSHCILWIGATPWQLEKCLYRYWFPGALKLDVTKHALNMPISKLILLLLLLLIFFLLVATKVLKLVFNRKVRVRTSGTEARLRKTDSLVRSIQPKIYSLKQALAPTCCHSLKRYEWKHTWLTLTYYTVYQNC